MSTIRLNNITKRFGKDVLAVSDLSLEIKNGDFAALLGPSGCGKTTTMNMIAGLETPTSGDIHFNDKRVTDVPPGERDVGFVFQNYAIFTHMTAYDNIAFGLKVRKMPKSIIDQEVQQVAKLLGITHMLNRRAAQLSVNDMQKVALGRSIIVKPQIFLLDEPFSNLDAAFRAYMRAELKVIQRDIGQTMVYVTHDQIEAMSMADNIAIMNKGKLQQYGSPDDVYLRPVNMFVAKFIGSPSMNFIAGTVSANNGTTYLQQDNGTRLRLSDEIRQRVEAHNAPNVVLGIRPEHIDLADKSDADLSASVKVIAKEPLGPKTVLHSQLGDQTVQVLVKPGFRAGVGETWTLQMKPHRVYIFDPSTEEVIA